MPSNFTRPSLRELIDRAWSDIIGSVTGLYEWLRVGIEYGIARAIGGQSDGLHAHASWLVDQAFVQFAEEAALLRRGDERGVPRNAAQKAQGLGVFTGTGGNLNATTILRRADGWLYEVVDNHVGVTPPASILIRAVQGFEGYEGNLAEGQTLSFVSSVSGFDPTVTIGAGGLTGGAPLEDIEDYRDRLHDNIRTPVLGGAPGDHARWAMEVSGVSRAWEYRGTNGVGNPALGRVAVTFMVHTDTPGVEAIPDAPTVEAVRAHVQSKSLAQVIAFAPTPVALNYTVSVTPNNGTVRAAVEAEVADMVRRIAEPGGTIYPSSIREAISLAQGETSHTLTLPATDVVRAFGEISVPGVATFTAP